MVRNLLLGASSLPLKLMDLRRVKAVLCNLVEAIYLLFLPGRNGCDHVREEETLDSSSDDAIVVVFKQADALSNNLGLYAADDVGVQIYQVF